MYMVVICLLIYSISAENSLVEDDVYFRYGTGGLYIIMVVIRIFPLGAVEDPVLSAVIPGWI